jgi:beta-lactamase regulating signal transducer with metallopeptidase domain
MATLDNWFVALAELAVVSFTVLAIGAVIVWRLKQPIERIRAIEWTLAAVIAALLGRESGWLPPLRLGLLPATAVPTASPPEARSQVAFEPRDKPTSAPRDLPMTTPAQTVVASTGVDMASDPSLPTARDASPSSWSTATVSLRALCVVVALAGAVWFVALWAVGRRRLMRLLRSATPASDEMLAWWPEHREAARRRTRVVISPQAAVPMTFGIWRPVIVLPADLITAGDRAQVLYFLSHEWAHVRGGDNRMWGLVRLLQPLLWYQPLFWRLRRELRLRQDQLADDFAARRGADPCDYAELLLGLAGRRQQWQGMPALTISGRPSNLRRRIELLLADGFSLAASGRRGVLAALAVVFTATTVVLGAAQLNRVAAKSADEENADAIAEETVEGAAPQDAPPTKENTEQPDGSLMYFGAVFDKQTKRPIEGAKVVVRRMISRASERRIVEESEHTTNAFGVYRFVIPPEQAAEKAMYIELDVEHADYAWKKGFGYSLTMIRRNLELGEMPFFTRVDLDPAEPVTGIVADPDGHPLAGVPMLAYSKASAEDYSDYGSFFRTETDAEGRFRINAVKGGPCIFWIVPEEFAPQQHVIGNKRGSQGVLRMEAGISLSGRVLSATGDPVAGAWVNMSDESSQAEIGLPVASSMNRSAQTDENGEFKLGPMKAGTCQVNVDPRPREIKYHDRGRSPKELDDIFVAQTIELTPADANRPITIQAVPHVEFRGQYVDSMGEPCPGHEVMVYGNVSGQWFHRTLRPDAEGRIVGRLPHGLEEARLDAITNEHGALHVRLKKDGPLHNPRDLRLGVVEDDVVGVEIVRYKAPIVQIAVVDEQGKQVKGAKVAGVYKNDYELMHPVDGSPTHIFFEHQADGRFRTSQMLPDLETTFTATAEGFKDSSETLSLPEGDTYELTLVIKKAGGSAGGDDTTVADAEMTENN